MFNLQSVERAVFCTALLPQIGTQASKLKLDTNHAFANSTLVQLEFMPETPTNGQPLGPDNHLAAKPDCGIVVENSTDSESSSRLLDIPPAEQSHVAPKPTLSALFGMQANYVFQFLGLTATIVFGIWGIKVYITSQEALQQNKIANELTLLDLCISGGSMSAVGQACSGVPLGSALADIASELSIPPPDQIRALTPGTQVLPPSITIPPTTMCSPPDSDLSIPTITVTTTVTPTLTVTITVTSPPTKDIPSSEVEESPFPTPITPDLGVHSTSFTPIAQRSQWLFELSLRDVLCALVTVHYTVLFWQRWDNVSIGTSRSCKEIKEHKLILAE